jgi:hypothetical protein
MVISSISRSIGLISWIRFLGGAHRGRVCMLSRIPRDECMYVFVFMSDRLNLY